MRDDGADVERRARLAAIDWGKMSKKLVIAAHRLGASHFGAEDLVSSTITHVLEGKGGAWNYEADPSGFRFLLSVMDDMLHNKREKAKARAALADISPDTEAAEAAPPDSDRNPESLLLTREQDHLDAMRFRERLSDKPVAQAILDICRVEGQLDPRVLAERLGVEVEAIYTAEALIRRRMKQMIEEVEEDRRREEGG